MKKVVLVLMVLVSSIVKGGIEPTGIIPGKGTGDRVLLEDTRQERMNSKVRSFIASKNNNTNLNESFVSNQNDESRIIANLKKQGYRITDVERVGGAAAYMLERETSYSFCAVVVTFYNGELQGEIVKQCL